MERSVSDVEFCNLAYDGNLLKMQAFLDADPSLSGRRDSNQRTALHWACSSGQTAVVGFLLTKGAEVNINADPVLYCTVYPHYSRDQTKVCMVLLTVLYSRIFSAVMRV